MRDLDALLNSLVNIDRHSLIAILASEAEAGQRSVNSARQRTASQRAKQREAVEHLARVDRILSFFQHGDIAPDMSERDSELRKSFEKKLRARGHLATRHSHEAGAHEGPLEPNSTTSAAVTRRSATFKAHEKE